MKRALFTCVLVALLLGGAGCATSFQYGSRRAVVVTFGFSIVWLSEKEISKVNELFEPPTE